MLGYRSIGEEELIMLLFAKNPIYGRRCWASSEWVRVENPPNYGTVCFFEDDYKWRDKKHYIDIVVKLKNPHKGYGIYLASKKLEKTHIWTGRVGKSKYHLRELYVRKYTIKDVVSINLNNRYANWFAEKVKSICEENGILFLNEIK